MLSFFSFKKKIDPHYQYIHSINWNELSRDLNQISREHYHCYIGIIIICTSIPIVRMVSDYNSLISIVDKFNKYKVLFRRMWEMTSTIKSSSSERMPFVIFLYLLFMFMYPCAANINIVYYTHSILNCVTWKEGLWIIEFW